MSRSESLDGPFQAAQPELQNYVVALESENAKLHKQIAKLEAQDMSKQNRIAALEYELKEETKKHSLNLSIGFSGEKPASPVGDAPA
jgi:predicted  nucleic acid-binding Zn-ribbon protein